MLRFFTFLLILFSLELQAATFTVSNLGNTGLGTLRQCIIDANGNPGADDIVFSIAGVINVSSALPSITEEIHIDGTTAPGYVCNVPVIAIDGSGLNINGLELLIGASNSIIRGLNIRNCNFNGIRITSADNCQIKGCFIGTNLAGTAVINNGQDGILAEVGAQNILIGGSIACDRNIISGNSGFGVTLNNSPTGTISGNYIGTDVSGNNALGNTNEGIQILFGSDNSIIGGSILGEGNVISGNGVGLSGNGFNIDSATGCRILGNYVGLNAAGTTGLGNSENGIYLFAAPNTIIGGIGANDGNVVADHNFHGIILDAGSNNCVIQGNKSGTNAAGNAAIGNDDSGIIILNSSGAIIGGNTLSHGNILCGSLTEYGILCVGSTGNAIQGNFIGTDITETIDLGNNQGGIFMVPGSGQSNIGGVNTGESNIIAYNDGFGVSIDGATSNQVLISRNSIYCNTGKGIQLNGTGNNNLASPTITAGTITGCSGTSLANQIIEIFNDNVCSTECQGKDYITTVTANASGVWTYTGSLFGTISAVAIDPNNDNTSEFSNCFLITTCPAASAFIR